MFCICQAWVKLAPAATTVPFGRVLPAKLALLQSYPNTGTTTVGPTGVDPRGVNAGTGVELNDNVGNVTAVGSAPEDVGNASVGRATIASVGTDVEVGAARAVWVNCRENCATVVPTIAVLTALISSVGAGVAPGLHDASNSAVVNRM